MDLELLAIHVLEMIGSSTIGCPYQISSNSNKVFHVLVQQLYQVFSLGLDRLPETPLD